MCERERERERDRESACLCPVLDVNSLSVHIKLLIVFHYQTNNTHLTGLPLVKRGKRDGAKVKDTGHDTEQFVQFTVVHAQFSVRLKHVKPVCSVVDPLHSTESKEERGRRKEEGGRRKEDGKRRAE